MKIERVEFEVLGEIITKARPRARVVNGKFAQIYTPKTTAVYENLVKLSYHDQVGNKHFGEEPLVVTIEAFFTCPEALKKYQDNFIELKCVNHKDLDNIAKTILDALNGIAYKDDKQVCELVVKKSYSKTGYDYVQVSIMNVGGSLEDAKSDYNFQKLIDKRNALMSIARPTKAQKDRLEKINKELDDYKNLPF